MVMAMAAVAMVKGWWHRRQRKQCDGVGSSIVVVAVVLVESYRYTSMLIGVQFSRN